MRLPIADRKTAGRELAAALAPYRGRPNLMVLALPRGGVPVAAEIAEALDANLDLMLVRKLGMPGQEELAIGAIASGGARVLNEDMIRQGGIGRDALARVTDKENRELARRALAYRGERPWPSLAESTVILVDDGLATGATMRAAVAAVRQYHPRETVVAVPVAPPDTITQLRREVDEVVCLATPEPFIAIGNWYRIFDQTADDEVRALLARFWDE